MAWEYRSLDAARSRRRLLGQRRSSPARKPKFARALLKHDLSLLYSAAESSLISYFLASS